MLTEEQKAALIKRHATTYRNRVVDTKALGFTEADLNALIADVEQAVRREMDAGINQAIANAVAIERDICARQCEDIYSWRGAFLAGPMCSATLEAAAAAIRARGSDAARGQT